MIRETVMDNIELLAKDIEKTKALVLEYTKKFDASQKRIDEQFKKFYAKKPQGEQHAQQ